MSITTIHNDAVKLREENRKLMEVNAKLRETAQQALLLIDKHKALLAVVVAQVKELQK